MTIRSRFFDSQAGDRVYTSEAWRQIFQRLVSEGYVAEAAVDSLKVTETSPTGLKVKVNLGVAWVQGRFFEVHTDPEEVTLAGSDPTNPRDDRIVVRLSYTDRTITLAALTGVPAVAPDPPALTRDANTYEISLAKVRVPAAASAVTDADITDERDDPAVAGRSRPVVSTAASGVSYDGAPGLSATDVEAALDELDAKKQALSEKGQTNGYAPLDADDDVPLIHLGKAPSPAPTVIHSAGSAATGIEGTLVAEIEAGAGKKLVAVNGVLSHANDPDLQTRIVVTYTDATTTTVDTPASKETIGFIHDTAVIIATDGGFGDAFIVLTNAITKIRVETLGTSATARRASLTALEVEAV